MFGIGLFTVLTIELVFVILHLTGVVPSCSVGFRQPRLTPIIITFRSRMATSWSESQQAKSGLGQWHLLPVQDRGRSRT